MTVAYYPLPQYFKLVVERWGLESLPPYLLGQRFGSMQGNFFRAQAAVGEEGAGECVLIEQFVQYAFESLLEAGEILLTDAEAGSHGVAAEF